MNLKATEKRMVGGSPIHPVVVKGFSEVLLHGF